MGRAQGLIMALAVALAASLGVAAPALAQVDDDVRARNHFEAARSYYEQDRFEEAAREFEEAHRLSGRPELLHNASQAHERAGNLDEAITWAEAYLAQPEIVDEEETRSRFARLIAERDERDRNAASAAAEPAPAPAPSGLQALSVTGIIVGGVGILALGAAIGTGVASDGVFSDLRGRCPNDVCPAGAGADIDQGRDLALSSTILLPVSLALIGAGAALLVVDLTSGPESEGAARLRGGPGLAGLTLELDLP